MNRENKKFWSVLACVLILSARLSPRPDAARAA